MDWTQTATLGGTIIGYITAMSVFFYYLNEKNIGKLEKGMKDMETRHREDIQIIREDIKENNLHWREMFMYMNNKIDEVKRSS